MSMSLDGFVAGPNQSEENPLGEGGMRLHEWAFPLAAWRERHGLEGGEVNASSKVVEESVQNLGATIMGRNMFGGSGPWTDEPWEGWWGEEPPFHTPVFIVTHHERPPVTKRGGTSFTGGGAIVAQEYLRAGLIDELQIHLVPVMLGDGARLFAGLGDTKIGLECVGSVAAPGVTHLTYRVS
ncbi:MAG: dihydrofolate reductase [Actinobacteria bacterium]|nr:MAG: dihydrofolate reductase [Actinomycetota bacterium]